MSKSKCDTVSNAFVNWCKLDLLIRIKSIHNPFTDLKQVLFFELLLNCCLSKNGSIAGLVSLWLKSSITMKSL